VTFRFADPWVFWLLAAIPLWAAWSWVRGRRAPGVMVSVFGRAAAAGGSWRVVLQWLAPLARAGALAMLVVALARPQELIPHSESSRDAIALQLVVDRSGSMEELAVFEGERVSRLEAVKRVVRRFVSGDGAMYQGRAGDLIGLVAFGTYADTLSPLTGSHDALLESLDRLTVSPDRRERATAIGDGLVLAVARMRAAEDAMKADLEDPDFAFRSKAIVLLTDGENNAGVYSPDDGAALAAEWGMRVYIVGLREASDGGLLANMRRGVMQQHERAMRGVAEATGGQFWAVDSVSQLGEVYARIDELERTEIRVTETTEIVDLYHVYAVLAFVLLGAEMLLRGLAGGRLP
jgi:Ca-activated chloride channel family protein